MSGWITTFLTNSDSQGQPCALGVGRGEEGCLEMRTGSNIKGAREAFGSPRSTDGGRRGQCGCSSAKASPTPTLQVTEQQQGPRGHARDHVRAGPGPGLCGEPARGPEPPQHVLLPRPADRAHTHVLLGPRVFSVLGYWELSGPEEGDDRETEGVSSEQGGIPPPGPETRGLEIRRVLTGRACWSLSAREQRRDVLKGSINTLTGLERGV